MRASGKEKDVEKEKEKDRVEERDAKGKKAVVVVWDVGYDWLKGTFMHLQTFLRTLSHSERGVG